MDKQGYVMKLSLSAPFKWPFPPPPKSPSRAAGGRVVQKTRPARLTRRAMVGDIVLVIVWGASIPAIMWLGAAGGF